MSENLGKQADQPGRPARAAAGDLVPPSLPVQTTAPQAQQAQSLEPTEPAETESTWWSHTVRGMTGWMISMVVHLTLILLLAVFTLGVAGSKPISLQIDSPSNSEDLVTFDVVIDANTGADLQMNMETPEPVEVTREEELAPLLTDALELTGPQSLQDDYEPISSSGVERILSQTTEGATEGVKFFGVKGKGSRFVFIIDCSGSMDEYRRWRRAVRELKTSINNLMEPQKFLVLLYNSYTVAMNNQDARLVIANRENQTIAINWIGKQTPFGNTYVATSLKTAFELRPDAIFLLSDGEFDDLALVKTVLQHYNGSGGNASQVASLGSPLDRMIPVHTISLGGKAGAWTMRQIAEQNQGTHTVIDD
ncbi:MAG: hypothetical protein MK108_05685 [Mariniblastus sp.]|nr:hypothetical protein [Mariniblastus sp.]